MQSSESSMNIIRGVRSCRKILILPRIQNIMSFHSLNTVSVRSVPTEDHITLSFTWEGKFRQMKRAKNECLGKALKRMAISLSAPNKKTKKKKNEKEYSHENTLIVNLYDEQSIVNESLCNEFAWKEGNILRVGEQNLHVTRNPPNIISLKLPNSIMSGFPVFPLVELEFADIPSSSFTWYIQKSDTIEQGSSVSKNAHRLDEAENNEVEKKEWVEVSKSFKYTPSVQDINCLLKVVCLPGNIQRKGMSVTSTVSPNPVSAGPGPSPFDQRHLYTAQTLTGEKIRIVSYNILAELYSREEFALTVLYPYCPQYALDISFRQHLIVKEILGYNADIICLQECGRKFYDDFLMPTLLAQGYNGCFKSKMREIPEGEATFFRTERFKFIMSQDIELSASLCSDPWQSNLLHSLQNVPKFLENVARQSTIAQVIFLKSLNKPAEILCISNTHLYFKPNAPHVRLAQTALILNGVENICSSFSETFKGSVTSCPEDVTESSATEKGNIRVSRIFCGDFNSLPHSAVLEFMCNGCVMVNHPEWNLVSEDERCQTLDLRHNFKLANACGIPEFTTYTAGFKGTLDYIFVEKDKFDVEAVIPFPSEEELMTYVALPSVVMPSDHLPLVCELKWKNDTI